MGRTVNWYEEVERFKYKLIKMNSIQQCCFKVKCLRGPGGHKDDSVPSPGSSGFNRQSRI